MAEPVEWPTLSKQKLAAIAPLNKDGRPDMYNHVPTRLVTQAEALARGWKHFYTGEVCGYGHKSTWFANNDRMCVDCHRVRKGRLPMGGRGEAEYTSHGKHGTYSQRDSVAKEAEAVFGEPVLRPPEPDPLEKRFLKAYAEHKDFQAAAQELGKSIADFQARLSYSKTFRDAVAFLEEQYGLSHTASLTEDFDWTDDKRVVFFRAWINTGDLAAALSAIGCSNWAYETELQDNSEFAAAVDEMKPWALKVMDREAITRAYKGDSRLLQRIMEAHMPDLYGPRMNVNMNVTEKLSDDQINTRILQLAEQGFARITSRTVDAEFTELEPQRALEPPRTTGDESAPSRPQSNLDLL